MPRCVPTIMLGMLLLPGTAWAAGNGQADSAETASGFRVTRTDVLVVAGGAAAWVGSQLAFSPRTREVPPQGLDPAGISLVWDRNSLKTPNPSALTTSDAFLAGSALYPALSVFAVGREPQAVLRMGVIQAQAVVLSGAASTLIKVATSRARPFAYLPEEERAIDQAYDVAKDDAFKSFPSGHATLAWASAMSGVSYLATQEPDLSFAAHFLSGAAAGGLATATSLLRVEGTKHFPTDVAGGAVLGGGIAVGMALIRDPSPGESAWLPSLLGVAAGGALAMLFTPPTSPWVH